MSFAHREKRDDTQYCYIFIVCALLDIVSFLRKSLRDFFND